MKKILFLVFFSSLLFSQTQEELYYKAQILEKEGDIKDALFYYKKAAEIGLKKSNVQKYATKKESSNISNVADKTNLATIENTQSEQSNSYSQPMSIKEKIKLEDDKEKEVNYLDLFGIQSYEPLYFIYTHNFSSMHMQKKEEVKFQLSFKKNLWYNLLGMNETFAFAYTQVSWWQIWGKSSPLRETNYRPEFMLTVPMNYGNMQYLKYALEHESNGRDGSISRSWNKAYVESNFKFFDESLELTPRIWYSFFKTDNKDINKYMGYGDLRIAYNFYNQQISVLLRNNLHVRKNKGAIQVDWTFPILRTGVYGYLQYFNGYGESLIDYNKHRNKIGLGISLYD